MAFASGGRSPDPVPGRNGSAMRLSTRLLLPLLVVVVGVMSLYMVWALEQRQQTLEAEGFRSTRAYATALGLALESAFRDPELRDVQEIVDRISREPEIYGVLVYGGDGAVLFGSDLLRGHAAPAAGVGRVLASGAALEFERSVEEHAVHSVLRPLRDDAGGVIGAFEVAQPLSFIEAERARTRQRFLLNTLTLLVAVTVMILWLVRRVIARPLGELVAAARALGRGELGYRLRRDGQPRELEELGHEFNRMADRLEAARAQLLRETEERLALEQRLRQSEAMAAVGGLAAGLAHEIAAPLHVVSGRAEMLLKREVGAEARERNLRIIVDQIGRITVIVRNLLDFARRREPQLEPVALGDVLAAVVEFLEGEFARAGVRIRWEGGRAGRVMGDRDQLFQVFVNLLLNAVHALEQVEGDREVRIRTLPADGHAPGEAVRVEVIDTGPGIPAEHLPRLFEPFFTTKPGGEGTGLGLAVARGIVEEHDGSIEASVSAEGTVFRVDLPAAPPAEEVGHA